jgi:hypothetical protein
MKTALTSLRLLTLILAFGLILYAMSALKGGGLPPFIMSLLGTGPSGPRLSWCDTRVISLERPSGLKIFQDHFKWKAQLGATDPRELDFVSVEKWLGRHCTVGIKPSAGAKLDTSTPALVVEFLKGQKESLMTSAPGHYFWKGQSFESPQLDEALAQLDRMAQVP